MNSVIYTTYVQPNKMPYIFIPIEAVKPPQKKKHMDEHTLKILQR